MLRSLALSVAVFAVALALAPPVASADTYPSRPIKIVVGAGAGSTNDVRLRQINERLGKALGQPTIVENRPGASGTLGAIQVAKAAPDGYTLLYAGASELAVEPAFRIDLPYKVSRDFAPIIQLGFSPAVLLIDPAIGVRSMQDLVALARAKPGQLTCASFGTATLTHLLLLQLNREAELNIVHVPYKNPAGALTDVAAGHLTMTFDYMVSAGPLIKAGRLIPLMVVGDTRLSVLPDTPSAAEVGLPGVDRRGWAGFLAPAGTPKEIIQRLNTELARILRSEEMRQIIAPSGGQVVAGTPEEFGVLMREQQASFTALIKASGVRPE